MNQRSQAIFVALALLCGLGFFFGTRPGEFTVFMPGPTLNVLGKYDDKPIVSVTGRRSYRDDGQLRLVTISTTRPEDRVGLLRALEGWFDPTVDVYPYRGIYSPTDTNDSTREQSAAQMTSSKDAAVAAALTSLNIRYGEQVAVAEVSAPGPSKGKLRAGDRIVSVQGKPAGDVEAMVRGIRVLPPGSTVEMVVRRDGRQVTEQITTKAAGTTGIEARQSLIGVAVRASFDFPFSVKFTLDENIGGPSAGLMFALATVDLLTPGSMTGGKAIAGTGEIDEKGRVGSIGGVRQKIAGAEHDGAHLFLVPADNCAEALTADYDPSRIRLVRVDTLEHAESAISTWVEDPAASLPSCKESSTA